MTKVIKVKANNLIGSVYFDAENNNNSNIKFNSDVTPKEIYFKNGTIYQIPITIKSGVNSADVYYQIGNNAKQQLNNSQLTCPSAGESYTNTYKLLIGDTVIEEYTLKGYSPTGSIDIVIVRGNTELRLVGIASNRKPVTTDNDFLSLLEHTSC